MVQLLKDATNIDCSIMVAVFGGGNSDMESHTRSCVNATGSKELRRWRGATPASAKEGADNFASASLAGASTPFFNVKLLVPSMRSGMVYLVAQNKQRISLRGSVYFPPRQA
jgi:hypothetical protein